MVTQQRQFCWGKIQEGGSHVAFFNFPFPFTIRPLIFSSTGKLTLRLHVNCWQLYFTSGKTRAKGKEEKKQRPRIFLSNYISTEWSIFLSPLQSRQSPVNTLYFVGNAPSSLASGCRTVPTAAASQRAAMKLIQPQAVWPFCPQPPSPHTHFKSDAKALGSSNLKIKYYW